MGLNLRIKRIIFHTLRRMTASGETKVIDDYEIKQIAGRAGRFMEDGQVLCMRKDDLVIVRKALRGMHKVVVADPTTRTLVEGRTSDEEDDVEASDDDIKIAREPANEADAEESFTSTIDLEADEQPSSALSLSREFAEEELLLTQAGLFPKFQQLESFARKLEVYERRKSSLRSVFKKFVAIAQYEGLYFIQSYSDFCEMAAIVEKFNMEMKDQFTFSSAPLHLSKMWGLARKVFTGFAKDFAEFNNVRLPPLLKVVREKEVIIPEVYQLGQLEEIHHILDVYLWLANHYESSFPDKDLALAKKEVVCEMINYHLESA
eukprot:TRINITY_DN6474_c0_g1_i10.p2 TRINITY_DN6474_c0_g1~~TRINITY_DN6474_c0_g1_i10.p2  ORF type:complete len:319 (-),score=95.03 TRINITY_DN6474_c0_g1_i10:919-1875(-)